MKSIQLLALSIMATAIGTNCQSNKALPADYAEAYNQLVNQFQNGRCASRRQLSEPLPISKTDCLNPFGDLYDADHQHPYTLLYRATDNHSWQKADEGMYQVAPFHIAFGDEGHYAYLLLDWQKPSLLLFDLKADSLTLSIYKNCVIH